MSSEFLLVDGYNIIYAWNELKNLAEYSLEDARDKLLEILSNYQGFKAINIIVVFDAHKVKGNLGKIFLHNNIYVVYTKEAETADNYIEKTASGLTKGNFVRVATSDGLEQIIILGQGAIRVSARELNNEVKQVEKKIQEQVLKSRPVKNNMLLDNLSEEIALQFEKMRRQKN